jgi:hypothetical protein
MANLFTFYFYKLFYFLIHSLRHLNSDFLFRMGCKNCIFLSTLCLTHHWALGATTEPSLDIEVKLFNDFELNSECPLMRPIDENHHEPIEVRFYRSQNVFPYWANNKLRAEELIDGPLDIDELDVSLYFSIWRLFFI